MKQLDPYFLVILVHLLTSFLTLLLILLALFGTVYSRLERKYKIRWSANGGQSLVLLWPAR